MSEQSAQKRRIPARKLSLLGVACLVIGATTYFAVPAWSGTSADSADARASASPNGQPTLPGPMPGAPTQLPTLPPPPTVGPQAYVHVTPTALRPLSPFLVNIWNAGPGGKALATVTALANNTLLAETTGQYSIMLPDCKELDTAVLTALLTAPIPDLAMQLKYTVALGTFKLAARGCMLAIRQAPDGVEDTVTQVNQTLIDTVASELSSGVSDLFTATEMIRQS